MYRQSFFRLLCGNSCDDGRRAIEISDIVLKYQNRADTALLTANRRIQIRKIYISASDGSNSLIHHFHPLILLL